MHPRSPPILIKINDATNPCRSVSVFDHGWRESQTIVRFSKTRIYSALQKLINRRTVTISTVKIFTTIKAQPERIDLPTGIDLYTGTIRAKAKDVTRMKLNLRPILCRQYAGVIKAMGCIDPTIVRPHPKTRTHPMGIFLVSQRTKQDLPKIRLSVARGIGKIPDIWNTPCDTSILVFRFMPGQHSGGNVETVGKINHLVSPAIAVSVLQNLNGIPAVTDLRAL